MTFTLQMKKLGSGRLSTLPACTHPGSSRSRTSYRCLVQLGGGEPIAYVKDLATGLDKPRPHILHPAPSGLGAHQPSLSQLTSMV